MPLPSPRGTYDAVVVGAGPNGLTAAARLVRAGLRVLVLESAGTPGGGCRTAELTLPGHRHDICAAVHPMGVLSPAFRELRLSELGVRWVHAPEPLAHPLPDGRVALLRRSLAATAEGLIADGPAWRRLMAPFCDEAFLQSLLQPLWRVQPRHLGKQVRFGRHALRSCAQLVEHRFRTEPARALLTGCAAHANVGLDRAGAASFGLVLALAAQAGGWPCAAGGSQEISAALVRALQHHGGTIATGVTVRSWRDVPEARAVLFDINPRQVAAICGEALPRRYRERLERFPAGAGVFKVDWALDGPIPWRDPACGTAMTVHIGGTAEDIAWSESLVAAGRVPPHPFVIVAQQSLFDPARRPDGRQTGWGYCHVPHGCTVNMTETIEAAIEVYAPGFRQRILARHVLPPVAIERHNPAMPGGDIGGGRNDLRFFLFRPTARWDPYRTPHPGILLCSSSTPPGGGVHGMCGWHAAGSALRHVFGIRCQEAGRSATGNLSS